MKAFFAGLIFLIFAVILAGIGIILFPLLIILSWILRFLIMAGFVIFSVWLLGKLIIFVWGELLGK